MCPKRGRRRGDIGTAGRIAAILAGRIADTAAIEPEDGYVRRR